MGRILVVTCDPCSTKDIRTEAKSHTISLDGRTMEIDLCERDAKEYINPLLELMEEFGRKVDAPQQPSSATPVRATKPCPECQGDYTRDSMRGHLINVHGVDRRQVVDTVREMFGVRRAQAPFEKQCPECAAEPGDMSPDEYTYDTPQGLSAHRRSAHDAGHVAKADDAA